MVPAGVGLSAPEVALGSARGPGEYPDACDLPVRKLCYDLVSIPSPSGEEGNAAVRLAAFFEANGRDAWLDEAGNVRAPADDSVLLTSHIDTVPGDVPVEIREVGPDEQVAVGTGSVAAGEATGGEPILWGRGAVDATGSLAAMAVAAVETGVSFVGVASEETDSRGARHLVRTREAPEAVVNGEPSGWDAVTLGYRGLLSGTYTATTASAHSSRPEPTAIEHALDWWAGVTARLSAADDADGPVFEQVTAKPVTVEGGTAEDGLAVEATMDVQLRIPPSWTAEELRSLAEAELERGAVDWDEPILPVLASPRTDLARALRVAVRETGGDPRLLRKTGTSDMNIYADAWDCPTVTYGPGDSDLDHAPDERLSLVELDRATSVLAAVCRDRR